MEEYIEGAEYSVETISYKGEHTCLAVTKKFTTGSPHYIETGHLQPAPVSEEMYGKIQDTVFRALDALEIRNGAGHSELRIDKAGNIRIIEIGSRMGGDCIGSDLVPLSTGQDFVAMAVDTAAGKPPVFTEKKKKVSAIRFLMDSNDLKHLQELQKEHPDKVKKVVLEGDVEQAQITDSGSRPGFFILQTDTMEEMEELFYHGPWENPLRELPVTPIQKLRFTGNGRDNAETAPVYNDFYMKREDLLPYSFGGNKVRFAQKFIEDMKREHCDSMIIYGNYHSNLCRILATLCFQLHLPCYMVHNTEDVKEDKETENSRIIRSMGVTEIPCKKTEIADAVQKAVDELREKGCKPYYIYGNTRGEGDERNIVGISVSRNETRGKQVIARNLEEYAQMHKSSLPQNFKEKILFTDQYMENGYGTYSQDTADLIRSIYRSEGTPLDMTYTGKAFCGMVKYLEDHQIRNKNILFLHTGGTPLFFDFLEEYNL